MLVEYSKVKEVTNTMVIEPRDMAHRHHIGLCEPWSFVTVLPCMYVELQSDF